MGTVVRRFLSRGPGRPLPEDEFMLALVPAGTFVPFEHVQSQLLAARHAEDTDWVGITASAWAWTLVGAESAAIALGLRSAISRQVLICTSVSVERPERRSRVADLCEQLRRRVGFAAPRPPETLPARSRAERDVAAILDTLGF